MALLFTKSESLWLKILVFFVILFLVVAVYKYVERGPANKKEGFEDSPFHTSEKYILKRNQDVYDDFYAQVYKEIAAPTSRLQNEVSLIVQQTQPSPEASVILDVGSSTGDMIRELSNRGYENVYGIDISPSMVSCSSPNQVVTADFMLRNNFERNTFTHILCLGATLYEVQNKVAFFKNCYYWLKSGGYLVVHVIERPHHNSTTPINCTTTSCKNERLRYKAGVEASEEENQFLFIEQMIDHSTGQQRTQERQMYMKDVGDIVNDAIYCGFIVQGKAAVVSPVPLSKREYLYFFQK